MERPPDPPYRLQEFNWGIAYLTAPAVDLSFEPAGGGGRLLIPADLKLQPRSADGLQPEDRDRKVPAAVAATAAAAATVTPWPVFDMKQVRGNEWTVFVPLVKQTPWRSSTAGNLLGARKRKTPSCLRGTKAERCQGGV